MQEETLCRATRAERPLTRPGGTRQTASHDMVGNWKLGFAEEGSQRDTGDHGCPAEQLLKAGEGIEEHV
jgi:hypothetical protein